MRSIAIFTYNQNHRKTYDTLCLLKARGYQKVKIYAQLMTYTKKRFPLINHRLEQIMDIPNPKELCDNLGYEYIERNFNNIVTDKYTLHIEK